MNIFTNRTTVSYLLWFLGAVFIILGMGYDTLTPIFENSDETLHYPYIKYLADGNGLPLAIPGQLWNQEGTQPPLYYGLVAASTFWIDSNNLPELLQRNPHWLFSDVRTLINDNQNLVLHNSPADSFPYHNSALAIHIGRWWSLLFGLIAVICTFFIVRHLFPDNLPLTLTTTALTALTPQFIRVSATVSNDSLSTALTTAAVLLALKFSEHINQNRRSSFLPPILLGLLCGLALLTKLSSLTTIIVVGVIISWRLFSSGGKFRTSTLKLIIGWLLIIVCITSLLTGWWFWRNYQLYGEWFATDTHLNLAGRNQIPLAELWSLRAEAERAYWATFGWGQIRPPEWVYQLLFWFSRIGFMGVIAALLIKMIRGKSIPMLKDVSFEKIAILTVWAGLNLLLYIRWVMEVGSVSHTRLVFPAIGAISLLLALGWHAFLPRRLGWWFSGLVTVLLLSLNIYSLGWLIYPAFSPSPHIRCDSSPQQLCGATSTLDLTFLDSMKLSNGWVYNPKLPQAKAKQGDTVIISVRWQVLAPLDKNYSLAAALLAPDGTMLTQRETYPGLGLRPTRYLQPDSLFLDSYPLTLVDDVTNPIVAKAVVNLFDFNSADRVGFPALNESGQEITPVVGRIKIVPTNWPIYKPDNPTYANFADSIALIGYDLQKQKKSLTLYWKSIAPVDNDYVIFIHLLDSKNEVTSQADAPPTNNSYPTSWWDTGEIIADKHTIPITPKTKIIRLGLYELVSGQRLTIKEAELQHKDNGLEIVLP